jgi:protein Tex
LLEGVVTNVANFGAFVDIGVHQDGLVHVSALADRFVKDPREVVKPGDIVKVKVLEVDLKRKRISLTMRLRDEAGARAPAPGRASADRPPSQRERQHMVDKPKPGAAKASDNALAAALSKAGFGVRK